MDTHNNFTRKGVSIWLLCTIFFLYEFFLRTVVGTFQEGLSSDLSLNSLEFSLVSTTMFSAVYGLMQIPAGLLSDRLGLRVAMTFSGIFCGLSCLCFSYSQTFTSLMLSRFFMGLGSSCTFVCLVASIYIWLPHRYSSFFVGFSQFIGTMGPMISAGPLESYLEHSHTSWRDIFYFLGLIGLFLGLVNFLVIIHKRQISGHFIILSPQKSYSHAKKHLLRSAQPWLIALFCGCSYFALEYLSENEGSAFLALKGLPKVDSAYLFSLGWLGYACGAPIMGGLSDYFSRRVLFMKIGSSLAFICFSAIIFINHLKILQLSFFFLGVGASSLTVGYCMIAEHFKKNFLSLSVGLNNTFVVLCAGINAPIMGALLDYLKTQGPLQTHHYQLVLSIPLGSIALALIISFFCLKETFCKSQTQFTHLNP